jgi:hypothetical protein
LVLRREERIASAVVAVVENPQERLVAAAVRLKAGRLYVELDHACSRFILHNHSGPKDEQVRARRLTYFINTLDASQRKLTQYAAELVHDHAAVQVSVWTARDLDDFSHRRGHAATLATLSDGTTLTNSNMIIGVNSNHS